MAQIKKWKVNVITKISGVTKNTYVYIDAPTSTEAKKIAQMQYPNANIPGTPSEA